MALSFVRKFKLLASLALALTLFSARAEEGVRSGHEYIENAKIPQWQFHWTNAKRLREMGAQYEQTGNLPLKEIRPGQNLAYFWPNFLKRRALYLWSDAGGALASTENEKYAGYGPAREPPRMLALEFPETARVLKLTTVRDHKPTPMRNPRPNHLDPATLDRVDLILHQLVNQQGEEIYSEWILLNPDLPKAQTASLEAMPRTAQVELQRAANWYFDEPNYHHSGDPGREYSAVAARAYLADPESNLPSSLRVLSKKPLNRVDRITGATFSVQPSITSQSEPRGFLVPNELFPEDQARLLSTSHTATPGAHISVGSERALIGSAANRAANALIVVDSDPEILRFHAINRFLLAVSQDREDYLKLRNSDSQTTWLRRLDWGPTLEPELEAWLRSPDGFLWWRNRIRDHGPMREALDKIRSDDFYLHSDRAFEKVRALARADRYTLIQGNLTEEETLKAIERAVERGNGRIASVDLSSAWKSTYLDGTGTRKVVEKLSPKLTPDGTWLLSLGGVSRGEWRYLAVPAAEARGPETLALLSAPEKLRETFNSIGSNRASATWQGGSLSKPSSPLTFVERCRGLFGAL